MGLYQAGDVISLMKVIKILVSIIFVKISILHCKLFTDLSPFNLRYWLPEYSLLCLNPHIPYLWNI